uniref:Peptidase C1A papain C-terminal domain-containing protein n=1 Tax=Panagrolaimus davidi TaxID=227884 RepID=A0A914QYE1_9BILA
MQTANTGFLKTNFLFHGIRNGSLEKIDQFLPLNDFEEDRTLNLEILEEVGHPATFEIDEGSIKKVYFHKYEGLWTKNIKKTALIFFNTRNWSTRTYFANVNTAFVENEASIDGICDTEYLFPEINWLRDGFVTPAKDQSPCYSCWAFPTVGLVEFWHRRVTGNLLVFSEQDLIDCGRGKYDLHGCETKGGGNVESGLKAIKKNGIHLLNDYPWVGKDKP